MIPEPLRQKLIALLDGDLPLAERDTLLHTLRDSAEARAWYEKIKQDSDRLKALPVRHLPGGFSRQVVTAIRARRIKPYRPRLVIQRSTLWSAAAAAGIIAVALGTFALLMTMKPTPTGRPDLSRSTGPEAPKPNPLTKIDPRIDAVPRHIAKVDPAARGLENWELAVEQWDRIAPTRETVRDYLTQWREVVEPIGTPLRGIVGASSTELVRLVEGLPDRLSGEGVAFSQPDVLTFPPTVRMPFKSVDVKLPLFLDLGKFESPELTARLKANNVYHVDLACKESWKAFERFQAACKSAGVKLVVDPEVTARVGKRYPAFYMAYLENVTPDQVAKILLALRAEEKSKGDHQFDSVMIQALEVEGRRKLAESLGLAPKALDQLPAGQGGAPAVKVAQPGQPAESTAVALICYPNRNRLPLSKEVKLLLDRRGWQPDAVHVVFLLRPDRG